MKWYKKLQDKFYRRSVAERIIIVVTSLMIVTIAGFVSNIFVTMQRNLRSDMVISTQKDIDLIFEKMDMFFDAVQNDAVTVLVGESCQKLLGEDNPTSDFDIVRRHEKYAVLRQVIDSYIGQKDIYGTLAFYDLYGNCYVNQSLVRNDATYSAEYKRISSFMSSDRRTVYTGLHTSPWRKQNRNYFEECISYCQKVYGLNSGKMIGVIEIEIPYTVIVDLYRTVMNDTTSIEIIFNDMVIASADRDALYRTTASEPWYSPYGDLNDEMAIREEPDAWYFLERYADRKWILACRISREGYQETIRSYLISLIVIALLVSIGSFILIRFLIRSITKPLSKITDAAVEIGQGNYSKRVSVKDGGEIGVLANEFNRMVDHTEELMSEIVKKEELKREAEMSMLQLQMTPHFFYNILESVIGLIYMNDTRTAVRTLQLLSGFYRGVLNKGREIIPLSKEVEITVNYLEIMKICHPGQFEYEMNLENGTEDCSICKLTLQPIMENAIHHGFENMSAGGLIRLHAWIENSRLCIDVEDNGCGIDSERGEQILKGEEGEFRMESFGLRNTDDRLKLYFGEEYGIRIPVVPEGTRIRIELPEQR